MDNMAKAVEVNQMLKSLNYFTPKEGSNQNNVLRSSILAFQNDFGLHMTGVVDNETWEALIKLTRNKEKNNLQNKQYEQDKLDSMPIKEDISDPMSFQQYDEYPMSDKQGEFGLPPVEEDISDPISFQQDDIEPLPVEEDISDPISFQQDDLSHIPIVSPVLKNGSTGKDVSQLQEGLIKLGYYNGKVDGIFGKRTEEAVRIMQRENGLVVDGIVGEKTMRVFERLMDDSIYYSPTTNMMHDKQTLKEGFRGEDVVILQTMLKTLGLYNGAIDGIFGPVTLLAVKTFQSNNNLIPDGIVGQLTWDMLEKAISSPSLEEPTFMDEDIFKRNLEETNKMNTKNEVKPTLKFGDTGEFVEKLQNGLMALGYYNGLINGIFDQKTLDAVKSFQEVNRLTPDGIVGKNTWSTLMLLFPTLID